MDMSIGAAAFWFALAAVLIAGGWFKSRSEALKHETLRQLAGRTGNVDEAQLRALLAPPPAPPMVCPPPPRPGNAYRLLRINGVVVASLGLGGMLACWLLCGFGAGPEALIGVAISSVPVAFGVGLFLSSRFAEPPADPANLANPAISANPADRSAP
jgi:hypothetical protein